MRNGPSPEESALETDDWHKIHNIARILRCVSGALYLQVKQFENVPYQEDIAT
jgi:hypothetical protein